MFSLESKALIRLEIDWTVRWPYFPLNESLPYCVCQFLSRFLRDANVMMLDCGEFLNYICHTNDFIFVFCQCTSQILQITEQKLL